MKGSREGQEEVFRIYCRGKEAERGKKRYTRYTVDERKQRGVRRGIQDIL